MSLPGRKLRLLLLAKAISKDAAPWKFWVLSTYCTDGLTIRTKDQVFLAWLTKPPAQAPSRRLRMGLGGASFPPLQGSQSCC